MVDEQWLYPMLGDRLRQARQRRHMTQRQLAERVGLSRASIANIEVGRQKILVHQVYAIAAALGADLTALLPRQIARTNVDQALAAVPEITRDEGEWVKRIVSKAGGAQ